MTGDKEPHTGMGVAVGVGVGVDLGREINGGQARARVPFMVKLQAQEPPVGWPRQLASGRRQGLGMTGTSRHYRTPV